MYGKSGNYEELEFIESSGTQWIDTDVTGAGLASYLIEFAALPKKINHEQYFAGPKLTPVPKLYIHMDGKVCIEILETSMMTFPNDGSIHTIEYKGEIKVDGRIVGRRVQSHWGDVSFYIFNSHEEDLPACMRLYLLQMYSDSVMIRDFRPVRRIKDGEVGLYDTVNETFYSNIGIGTFIPGNPTGQYY